MIKSEQHEHSLAALKVLSTVSTKIKTRLSTERIKKLTFAAFLSIWTAYFYFLWRDMIIFDGNGVRIGWIGVWGDWAMHFTQGSGFAYRSLWITQHPLLVGAPYSYPFIVNWISGLLIRGGMEFFSAFVVPSYIYSIVFVFILALFYRVVFRSRSIAMLATSVFLLNGGFGFWWYLIEIKNNLSLAAIFGSRQEFTHFGEKGIEWISVITSMMIPQRSFVFGFPIALCAAILIYKEIQKTHKDWSVKRFLIAGFLFGSLPLLHTHSFLALGIILVCWFFATFIHTKHKKESFFHPLFCWVAFGVAALIIAAPILLTFYRTTIVTTTSGSFIKWFPGWFVNPSGDHAGMNWMWWWVLNWGLTLPLGIIGWFLMPKKKKLMIAPFFVLFVFLNLFLFQPYIWDNTKFLVWASLGISGSAAYTLRRLFAKKHWGIRALTIFLFFIMIFSGGLDAFYAVDKRKHSWGMYTYDDLALARYIRGHTNSNDVFLTSDVHNNVIPNLTGRKTLMGFRAWLWTYGMNYGQIEKDEITIFSGDVGARELLKKYDIAYVAFDHKVLEDFHGNEAYYKQRYPVFYKSENYTIYAVK